MAIQAMALLQQHDARRDIPNWGHLELGAQSGRKKPTGLSVCLSRS